MKKYDFLDDVTIVLHCIWYPCVIGGR